MPEEDEKNARGWKHVIATAIAAALAALVPSVIGWIEVQSQKAEQQSTLDNYGSYIEETMKREEALERALMDCLVELHEESRHPTDDPSLPAEDPSQ
jgi:hypothetical protein